MGHLLSGAAAVKWKIDLTVCCLDVVYCFASYIQTMLKQMYQIFGRVALNSVMKDLDIYQILIIIF